MRNALLAKPCAAQMRGIIHRNLAGADRNLKL